MNIGIDIDDTISDTFEALLAYSQKYTIEDLKRESNIDINKDYLNHLYIESASGWNDIETKNFWEKYYEDILKAVNIKNFASKVINNKRKNGDKIFLITARWDMPNFDTKKLTENWLLENNVQYDKLFMNASDKVQLVKENNIDLFIDDSFNNCKQISENTNAKVYMMTSLVNKNLGDKKIKRVFSWPEIDDLISKEEN
jgi:uncharacterized HAD superfamily protein